MATTICGLLPKTARVPTDNFSRQYLGHVKPGAIFFWQLPHARIGMHMLCIWVSSSRTTPCPDIGHNLLFNPLKSWVHSHLAEFRYSVQVIKIGFASIAVIIQQSEKELKGMSCRSLKRPHSLSSSGSQHSMMEPSLPTAYSWESIWGSKLYRGWCLDIKG